MMVMIFALANLGCERFLKDSVHSKKTFELDLQGVKCLSGVPDVLTNYFQQKLLPHQLHDSTLCVDKALGEFLNSTRGSEAASYKTDEVKKFFQKYIFKREISPELAREIMKLKAAMIGGTEDVITRSEFEKLRGLLFVLEKELLRLYPHLNIYLLRETLNISHSDQKAKLNQAIVDLKLAVQNLLSGLHLADAEYSLPEVELLLAEIARFAGIDDHQHPFSQWRAHLPTLEKLKTLLVGEVVEVRGQKEINEIWDILIEVYRLGLQYYGGLKQMDWITPQNYPEFDLWVEDLFSILNRGFALRNEGQIPFARIDDIIEEFYGRGLWIKPLTPETVKISYRRFITRFLDTPSADLVAVDARHLVKLHREYKAFKLIQIALDRLFAEKVRLTTSEVISFLEQYKVQTEIKKLSPLSIRDQEYFSSAWKEFLTLVKDAQVRHWDERGRVSVGTSKQESWIYQDLARMNLLRVPTSMFLKAYGTSGKNTTEISLAVGQIQPVFFEFQEFGDEMGLFDLRNTNSASRSAREADMFTPSANGDGAVQFTEMFDLFSVMLSGGLVGVSDFKRVAELEGCLLPELDYFHFPYFEMACASRTFKKYFGQIFSQLSQFNTFVARMDGDRWASFYKDLLLVGQVCPSNPIGLETGDQRTILGVLHYIENLFSVYDRDQDGRFSDKEVDLAFPRFRRFMIDVTKKRVKASSPVLYDMAENLDWSVMAKNVFKFLVFNGRAPSSDELGVIDFFSVRRFNTTADRQNIVRVFAALKSEIATASAEACNATR
jgi:hypothetical protein